MRIREQKERESEEQQKRLAEMGWMERGWTRLNNWMDRIPVDWLFLGGICVMFAIPMVIAGLICYGKTKAVGDLGLGIGGIVLFVIGVWLVIKYRDS